MADDATFDPEPAAGEEPANIVPFAAYVANRRADCTDWVFPLIAGTKRPMFAGGFHGASADAGQLREWARQHPDANVGFYPEPSGCFVLDVDTKDGKAGLESLATLEIEFGKFGNTRAIRTPSGGFHYVFKGSAPTTQGALGDGLDTRGRGGYGLLPPSVLTEYGGAAYAYENDLSPAEAPACLAELIESKAGTRVRQLAVPNLELDKPANVEQARSVAANAPPAIEGQGGDTATFKLAATLFDFGLSPAKVFEILQPWDATCEPPWGDELWAKVDSAAVHRQNEIGCYAVGSAAETFADLLAGSPANDDDFRPWTPAELARLPPPEWLIEGEIERHGRAMIYGPTNTGKTFTVLNYLLPLTLRGHDIVYVAGEDHIGQIYRRANAWAQFNGPDAVAAYQDHFRVVATMPLANAERAGAFCASMERHRVKPSVVILDTLSTALAGRKENDATDLASFWEVCSIIERDLDCSLFLVHHTGKDVDLGPRGSSNIGAGLNTMFELKADETAKLISLWMRKQRNAPKLEAPVVFKTQEVGGSVVLTRLSDDERRAVAKSNGASPGVTPDECQEALHRLGADKGGEPVATPILAGEIAMMRVAAGRPDTDAGNIARSLTNRAKNTLRTFVMHPAEHRGDRITWQDRCAATAPG